MVSITSDIIHTFIITVIDYVYKEKKRINYLTTIFLEFIKSEAKISISQVSQIYDI